MPFQTPKNVVSRIVIDQNQYHPIYKDTAVARPRDRHQIGGKGDIVHQTLLRWMEEDSQV